MERNGGGLDYLETPRKDLPQAVVDGKGTPSLNDDMAKLAPLNLSHFVARKI